MPEKKEEGKKEKNKNFRKSISKGNWNIEEVLLYLLY